MKPAGRGFRIFIAVLGGYAIMAAPVAALGQEASSEPSMAASSLKALGALILVLGLILVAAWLVRRYFSQSGSLGRLLTPGATREPQIQVLSARSLGPKRSVHLIEVEGRRMLIGSTDGGVRLLKDFDQPHNLK